jgi:hypothetical protein
MSVQHVRTQGSSIKDQDRPFLVFVKQDTLIRTNQNVALVMTIVRPVEGQKKQTV